LEPELAFWSKFAGAQAAQVLPLCAYVTSVYLFFFVIGRVLTRLELELIQTQMAQKPMLRAEVYAHATRASQNRKKEVRGEKEV